MCHGGKFCAPGSCFCAPGWLVRFSVIMMQLFSSAGGESAGVERKALYSAAPETAGAGGTVAEVLERWIKRGAVVHSERGGYSGAYDVP